MASGPQRILAVNVKSVIHDLEHVIEDAKPVRNILDDFLRIPDLSCGLNGGKPYLPVKVVLATGRDRVFAGAGIEVASFERAILDTIERI